MTCTEIQIGSIADWVQAVSSGLLVIVGYCGVKYAKKTFNSMHKQNQAIDKQKQAFITSERAWLKIEPLCGIFNQNTPYLANCPSWMVTNAGRTPAILVETQSIFELYNGWAKYDNVPDYGQPVSLYKRILVPGDSMTFSALWYTNENGTRKQVDPNVDVSKDLGSVRAFGYIKYINGFGQEATSRFVDRGEISAPYSEIKYVPDLSDDIPSKYLENT